MGTHVPIAFGTGPDKKNQSRENNVEIECQTSPEVENNVEQEGQSHKGSSLADSIMAVDMEHECPSPNACSIDDSQMDVIDESQKSEVRSDKKFQIDLYSRQLSQSPTIPILNILNTNAAEKDREEICVEPKIGIEFDSEDHAYKCYSRYAVSQGFSIRKDRCSGITQIYLF
ncbi:hypothetical protein L6164_018294 [Bauhinia variegata]|uniref:Uncharacterized protein n=1 Tax=Bauhinia variegata TaxID=167791 RepID=A0ACB9NAK1_BAUVA|nr:hypothetical protein L6164_018294 [Bauhinia variegata]